ncbi:MAG TPA: molybdate ABC transporter substrate-binding protein [Xanthobacteraceae bacterium]|nr:molybdate ABC transporter substrate-binding protein [Xanthobacteraceae bacterium]
MKQAIIRRAFFIGIALAISAPDGAGAAEIKVLTTRAVSTVLAAIGPQFERATGNKIDVSVDVAAALVRKVKAGEAFDLLVAAPAQIDGLVKDGKLLPDTPSNLVRSGIGVEVKAGAAKPDVSTVEAFRGALIAAKSIAYLREGQSGIAVAKAIDKIGLTETLKPKLTLPDADVVSEVVAKGEVELGMVVVTQIMTSPGVTLAGPLPPELQSYITFAGAVGTGAKAPDAARALIKFLRGPEALTVMKAQGMEPG